MDRASADAFAKAWVAAWNARDLDAILAHYADEVVFASPVIARMACDPSGTLHGKAALRAYFAKALESAPQLRFELEDVLVGVGEVVLSYRGAHGGRVVETMRLDAQGKVARASVAYARVAK